MTLTKQSTYRAIEPPFASRAPIQLKYNNPPGTNPPRQRVIQAAQAILPNAACAALFIMDNYILTTSAAHDALTCRGGYKTT